MSIVAQSRGLACRLTPPCRIRLRGGWAEQLCAQQGCRAGQAAAACSPRPGAQGLALAARPVLWRGRYTTLSKHLCDQALGRREVPFHPARFQSVCLPWCPTPASSLLCGRNFIF